ncbi:MAG: hypothetical protein NTW05_08575, partial [Pseudonocardiales bacterium]|nr:hypothetical protein [Pseudonocardiales bacterium]
MSGPAVVSRGAAVVRVARTGPDGEVRVLEAAAAPGAPPAEVLSGLVEGAGAVVVPAEPALALAGRGDAVVLDVGHGPATVVRVRGGAVVARRSGPGGADLDAAVAALLARSAGPVPLAEARRVREALSLLPAVEVGPPGERVRVPAAAVHAVLRAPLGRLVDAVRELAADDPVPVLVVGGVARTPLLARLLDEAGLPDVRVPSRPDAAALLAAHAALDPAAGPAP